MSSSRDQISPPGPFPQTSAATPPSYSQPPGSSFTSHSTRRPSDSHLDLLAPRSNPSDDMVYSTPTSGPSGAAHSRAVSDTNPFRARIAQQHTGILSPQSTGASTLPVFAMPAGAPSHFDFNPSSTNPFLSSSPQAPRPSTANPFGRDALSSSHDSRGSDKYIVTSSAMNTTASRSCDDVSLVGRFKGSHSPPGPCRSVPPQTSVVRVADDEWDLISFEAPALPNRPQEETGVICEESTVPQSDSMPAPPAPQDVDLLTSPPPLPERPRPLQTRPITGETVYPIRKVNWSACGVTYKSPILMQNANGPCPLMALVNALVLKAGASSSSGLKSLLLGQERISLDSLLQAVIEELITTSGPDQTLPDLGDLIEFLKGLHTGMNVNPRFIAKENSNNGSVPSSSEAGVVEDSLEMKFYSAFGIPLVHGWVPPRASNTYKAMARHAPSFEAAQDLLSREDEFEECLSSTGLRPEDQDAFQDMVIVKKFLFDWSTQLTPTGIESITNSLAPGAVCILFRNDHFSTLYRHADTLQLFSLVTDSGYLDHPHIVWETLVDVLGEFAEFYSGTFDVVHAVGTTTTDQDSQTDDDFALALRLQEEEENRGRTRQPAPGSQDARCLAYARNTTSPLINPRGTPLRDYQQHLQQQQSRPMPRLVPLRTHRKRPAVHRPTGETAQDGDELPSYEEAQADARPADQMVMGQRPVGMTPGMGTNGRIPMPVAPMHNNQRRHGGCRNM